MKIIITDDFINVVNFNENDTYSFINSFLKLDNVYLIQSSYSKLYSNYKFLRYHNITRSKIIKSKEINDNDVLIHFWFNDYFNFSSIKNIRCRKVFHLLEPHINSKEKREMTFSCKVDKIICYTAADKYDPFFKKYFQMYNGKVINLPFGFSDRFKIEEKKIKYKKCALLGSINTTIELDFFRPTSKEFYNFAIENDFVWLHPMRRKLSLKHNQDVSTSYYPIFPKIKKFDYDIIKVFKEFSFFYACESILNFPASKIFEGIACGCIPVIPQIEMYKDLGFNHLENCVYFYPNTHKRLIQCLDELPKISDEKIIEISKNCQDLARDNFSQNKIAERLYLEIVK